MLKLHGLGSLYLFYWPPFLDGNVGTRTPFSHRTSYPVTSFELIQPMICRYMSKRINLFHGVTKNASIVHLNTYIKALLPSASVAPLFHYRHICIGYKFFPFLVVSISLFWGHIIGSLVTPCMPLYGMHEGHLTKTLTRKKLLQFMSLSSNNIQRSRLLWHIKLAVFKSF